MTNRILYFVGIVGIIILGGYIFFILRETKPAEVVKKSEIPSEQVNDVPPSLGMVWYKIPELGVKFQVSAELASELIYVPLKHVQDNRNHIAFFLTNMTNDTIFFKLIPESVSIPSIKPIDIGQHKGVLFSTKQLSAADPECKPEFGPLGLLFAGPYVQSLKATIAGGPTIDIPSSQLQTYTDMDFVMAYPNEYCGTGVEIAHEITDRVRKELQPRKRVNIITSTLTRI